MVTGMNNIHDVSNFIAEEDENAGDTKKLSFHREGGCFVTTKKALFFVFLAIAAIVIAVVLMYFCGPNKNQNEQKKETTTTDLQKLLSQQFSSNKSQPFHFPINVHPLNYNLKIHPTFQGYFTGVVDILLLCVNETNTISLNAEDLNVNSSSVEVIEKTKQQKIETQNIIYHKNQLILAINLKAPLKVNNKYTLRIEYSGSISDNNFIGLYQSNYNKNKSILATNLQNNNAKRVFPCFDEPSLRATFQISIARKTNMISVSNMPLLHSKDMIDTVGWVWDNFTISPPMSVNSVAFTVCDCEENVVTTTNSGAIIRLWVTNARIVEDDVRFAKECMHNASSFLEDYFKVNFPLKKIDFVVMPNLAEIDVNGYWGLVFCRDFLTNFEDKFLQQHIFQEIARQFSYQWLGDLVDTNEWLVKGFALFISELMLDEYHLLPGIRSNYLIQTLQPALQEARFDGVMTEKKAASLLRMLYYVIPKKTFKNTLNGFLEKWRYKYVSTHDLWGNFTNQLTNNLTTAQFMKIWIEQPGYPVIHVNIQLTNNSIELVQKNVISNRNFETKWPIPLSYSYISSNENYSKLFWLITEKQVIKPNETIKSNTLLLFNGNHTGFYRINYDIRHWLLIQNQLENDFNLIPTKNRAQILNDALELAAFDYLDYNIALNLTKYLWSENEYLPWASCIQSFQDIKLILANTHYHELFKKYLVKLTEEVYNNLGTAQQNNETFTQKQLRNLILDTRCDVQEESCVNWAKRLYNKWMNSSKSIPHSLQKTVQCAALNAGNQKEWEFLWQNTQNANSSSDLEVAYLSLGCSRYSWIIKKYLELSLQNKIQPQYIPYVWKSLKHPVAIDSGFKFLRSNWDRIKNAYVNHPMVLKAIFEDFLSRLSTNIDLEDLTTFYKNEEGSLKEVAPMLLKTVEKIKFRIQWSSKYLVKVVRWLENYNNMF